MTSHGERFAARHARKVADRLAAKGMLVSFHETMPDQSDDLHIRLEVIGDIDEGSAVVIRNNHAFEGLGRSEHVVSPSDMEGDWLHDDIEHWLAPVITLLEGDAIMRSEGVDPMQPPLRHLTTHPVIRSVMRHSGVATHEFTTTSEKGKTSQTPNGMKMQRMQTPSRIDFDLEIRMRRVTAARIIVYGRNTIHVVSRDDGGVDIQVIDQAVPETLLISVVGRRLEEVIEHPALAHVGDAIVTAAVNTRTMNAGKSLFTVSIGPASVNADWTAS